MSASKKTRRLQHETRPGQALARRGIPWIGSILGHLVVIALVALLTWNLARTRTEKTTPVVTANISETTDAPIPQLQLDTEKEQSVAIPSLVSENLATTTPTGSFGMAGLDGMMNGLGGGTPTALGKVEFAGLGAGAARRIVFVVDASGSMIGVFPFVIAELSRSLAKLSPAQSYAVIFFQRDEALLAPPRGRLTTATNEHVERTIRWIRGEPGRPPTVVPTGRSNPMRALKAALELDPEVIFLLSSNVTGSGRYAVDLAELLEQLDQLNPIDPRSQRRETSINCIQFLDPDPLDALRRIVEQHGTDGGYRFLGRTELGLKPLGTPE